jgi:putative addiction module CopG family antidote
MNVSLTPELEELVNGKVRSGLYQTASEVVREALRLLKQRDDDVARSEQKVLTDKAARPTRDVTHRRHGR